jgi:hypothetical protein
MEKGKEHADMEIEYTDQDADEFFSEAASIEKEAFEERAISLTKALLSKEEDERRKAESERLSAELAVAVMNETISNEYGPISVGYGPGPTDLTEDEERAIEASEHAVEEKARIGLPSTAKFPKIGFGDLKRELCKIALEKIPNGTSSFVVASCFLSLKIQCPITLSDLEDSDDVICLPCKHLFSDQVYVWLKENTVCPMCKRDLSTTNST